jgi:hypothetical protein
MGYLPSEPFSIGFQYFSGYRRLLTLPDHSPLIKRLPMPFDCIDGTVTKDRRPRLQRRDRHGFSPCSVTKTCCFTDCLL